MMGHRDALKGGDEWDGLTKGGRAVHRFRAGVRKLLKRRVNKRARKEIKQSTKEE
jgi:hypothetical protein